MAVIQAIVVKFEGDAAGASDLLRQISGLITNGHAAPTAERVNAPDEPVPAPATSPRPCIEQVATERRKPGRKPGRPAKATVAARPLREERPEVERGTDGDRFAARGSELQQKIEDWILLNGPARIRDLAVAMKCASQGIGKSVSSSDRLEKDEDGFVYVKR